jgi:hypothetical protein
VSGAKGEFEIALQQHRHNVKWQFGVSFVRMHTHSHTSRDSSVKMAKRIVYVLDGIGFRIGL